jgi:hypothetical protein
MLLRCDGAVQKDGMGFNKPDAFNAMFLRPWLDSGVDEAHQAAALMLTRYYRQLHDEFPVLFPKKGTNG